MRKVKKSTQQKKQSLSPYHHILSLFTSSFKALGKHIAPDEIEYLGGLIYQVMSSPERVYHSPEHVVDLSHMQLHKSSSAKTKGVARNKSLTAEGAILNFSILFHDVIYLQVDGKIPSLLEPYLDEFQVSGDFTLIVPDIKELKNVTSLFGVKTGNIVGPQNGINEFLSAVIAARILGRYLTPWEIAQITCCIEATIPFRAPGSNGKTSSEHLYERLKLVNKASDLQRDESELIKTIELSVELANRDVGGFAAEDAEFFLFQSWKLLREGHPYLRHSLHTIRQYREAVQKIRKFHTQLPIDLIFKKFKKIPSSSTIQELNRLVRENRAIQDDYFKITLLFLGILEAIAQLTGGDAPYLLFAGQTECDDSIPMISPSTFLTTQKNIKLGRFIRELKHLNTAIEKNEEFLDSKITAMQFLKSLKHLKPILNKLADLVVSRQDKMMQLAKELRS